MSLTTRKVLSIGPNTAKIMLVGEAPGEREDLEGIPFVGSAGIVLNSMLNEAGIIREDCYITNVVNQRPPDSNFEVLYDEKGKPTEELKLHIQRLKEEIVQVSPNIVVCLGNEALRALTGHNGIKRFRGSIYYVDILGKKYKIISTYHPAAVGRMYEWRPVGVMDFQRASTESAYPDYKCTHRELQTRLDFTHLSDELKRLRQNPKGPIAFDIENEGHQVNAIAFSDEKHKAVCVPIFFDGKSKWSEEEEVKLWILIKDILECEEIKKIAQNAQYDISFLRKVHGIETRGLYMDTMLAHHVVYAELPKGLGFLCSVYTDQPYYKGDIKSDDADVFYRYNAMDACVTKEISEILVSEMEEFGVADFYFNYVNELVFPLMAMGSRGILINTVLKDAKAREYKEAIVEDQAKLDAIAGHPLNVNSSPQMTKWIYGDLAYEKQTKIRKKKDADGNKTSSPTTDASTLKKLMRLKPDKSLELILAIRDRRKMVSTYLDADVDADGRMRTVYNVAGTKSGRLSAQETLEGTGLNIQNVPKGLVRELFVPDPGMTFIQMDLSQAEAHIVAYLSGDSRLIRLFEGGGDIHRKNASNIFSVSEEEVSKDQRQLAKRIVHASNYGMGPIKFKETCNDAGFDLTASQAKSLLYKYHALYPGIHRWHINIATQVRKNRILETPMGRKRMFFGRLSDDLFREAYSFIPQAVVSDHLNTGLIKMHAAIQQKQYGEVLAQVHDSMLCQCTPAHVQDVIALMKECVGEGPMVKNKVWKIPMDFMVGPNWDALKEMKI